MRSRRMRRNRSWRAFLATATSAAALLLLTGLASLVGLTSMINIVPSSIADISAPLDPNDMLPPACAGANEYGVVVNVGRLVSGGQYLTGDPDGKSLIIADATTAQITSFGGNNCLVIGGAEILTVGAGSPEEPNVCVVPELKGLENCLEVVVP